MPFVIHCTSRLVLRINHYIYVLNHYSRFNILRKYLSQMVSFSLFAKLTLVGHKLGVTVNKSNTKCTRTEKGFTQLEFEPVSSLLRQGLDFTCENGIHQIF